MGRLAEVEGERELYRDLRMKLFIDPQELQAQYRASPPWLRKLMDAFADGLNFYLATHPQVKPKLIAHFEPWMALSFSEGSIGGDIESINLAQLEAFYGQQTVAVALASVETGLDPEPSGSNGFAIAPAITRNGHALLMINPHTSFYFRPEVQVTSGEGLNAYGAVTWGQFFVYQGFNERLGWMHTSGGGDVIDEYLESIVDRDGAWFYRYDGGLRPLKAVPITVPYKLASGAMGSKTITVYYSHHGPSCVRRTVNGCRAPDALAHEGAHAVVHAHQGARLRGLLQDHGTAHEFLEQHRVCGCGRQHRLFPRQFHSRARPALQLEAACRRQRSGHGMERAAHGGADHHPVQSEEWLDTEHQQLAVFGGGANSPRQQDYPAYMSVYGENARGLHAVKVFQNKKDFTLDKLIAASYDSELTAFEALLPPLFAAWDALPAGDAHKLALADKVALLRSWDWRYSLHRRRPLRWPCSGARNWPNWLENRRASRACPWSTSWRRRRSRRRSGWRPWPALLPSCSAISATGKRRGARSTATSA